MKRAWLAILLFALSLSASIATAPPQINASRGNAPVASPLIDGGRHIERVWLEWMLAGFSRSITVIQDTYANKGNYSAGNYAAGSFFLPTDQQGLAFVSRAGTWKYDGGTFRETLANKPTLGTNETGLLYVVTDYNHVLRWSGSAWTWGPGDDGSGYYRYSENAPTPNGWQVCDGSTVAVLNADATTSNVTTPNLATPGYIKGATIAAGVAAAGGTVAATTATNQNESAHTHSVDPLSTASGGNNTTVDVQSGSGTTVAANGHAHTTDIAPFTSGAGSAHTHTQNAHDHGPGTLELRNKQARCDLRR